MAKVPTVVLYGKSLVASTIAASLQDRPGLQVLRVDASLPQANDPLDALQPDVIVFDLSAARREFAVSLLEAHPKLMLISIDMAGGTMLVLTTEQTRALTTGTLVQVIERQANRVSQPPACPQPTGSPASPARPSISHYTR